MKKLLLVLALLFAPSLAHTAPIPFSLTLHVDAITRLGVPVSECAPLHPDLFFVPQYMCALGDVYTGHFVVDDSLLTLEGDNLPFAISDFFIQIGTVVYDQNNPFQSMFHFFSRFPEGLGAPGLNFNVHGGQITGLTGFVIGDGDVYSLDFFGTTYLARELAGNVPSGRLEIEQIVEPHAWWMLGVGLMLLATKHLTKIRRPSAASG
jgi:hypothetical protein